jgi:hypothetical protein
MAATMAVVRVCLLVATMVGRSVVLMVLRMATLLAEKMAASTAALKGDCSAAEMAVTMAVLRASL